MDGSEEGNESSHVIDGLWLGYEDGGERSDLVGVAFEVLFEIDVDEIGLELANVSDRGRLRSAEARTFQPFRKDAEVSDADDGVTGAEIEESFGQRRNE